MKKKIALLLAVIMIVSLMPMTVFAASAVTLVNNNANVLLKHDQRVLNSDGSVGTFSGASGELVSYQVGALTTISPVVIELTNAEWAFPDNGKSGTAASASWTVDSGLFIGNDGTTAYAIEKLSSTYARVTFYSLISPATLPSAAQINLFTVSNNVIPNVIDGLANGTGTEVILPIVIKFPSSGNVNDHKPQLRVTEDGVASAYTAIFGADVSFTRSLPSLNDKIQVFYNGDQVTDVNHVINLKRVTVQETSYTEKDGAGIVPRFQSSDYPFTVLGVHGKPAGTYIRRYVTLTAPEGYYWDYDTNLYSAIQNGSYNLIYNPTGVYAAHTDTTDTDAPEISGPTSNSYVGAWLTVNQIRNKPDMRSNEIVLDLDFATEIDGGYGNITPNRPDDARNRLSSFEIAADKLKLVKSNDYVVVTGDVPVRLTVTDYDGSHVVTQFFNVAKFSAGTNVILTGSGSGTVVGGAYGFIDNSALVQSAEPGTKLGTVTWKEESNDKAGSPDTIKFTVDGGTLVGAMVSYTKNDGTAVKFTADSRDYIPAGRTAYRQSYLGGAYVTNDNVTVRVNSDNTITVNHLVGHADNKDARVAIIVTPYVVASVDTPNQDITITADNLSTDTTLVIGKAIAPITPVVTEQAKGSLGKDIKGGTLTITEAQAGVINGSRYEPVSVAPELISRNIANRDLTVTLQNDVFGQLRFMPNLSNLTSNITITPATAGLSVASATTDADGVLHIAFNGVSTTAVSIEIKDIPFAANRLTYNGDYSVYLGGSALAANYVIDPATGRGVITNNNNAIKANIQVDSFVNIADTNLGVTTSIDTEEGKVLIAQILVDRVADEDGNITTVGSIVDPVTGAETVLEAAPILKNGRIYMPLREVSNLLGIGKENVSWDDATKTAMIEDGDRAVYFTRDSESYTVFNQGVVTHKMDAAAFIDTASSLMYVPVKYLAHGISDGTALEDATSTPNNRVINVYSGQ